MENLQKARKYVVKAIKKVGEVISNVVTEFNNLIGFTIETESLKNISSSSNGLLTSNHTGMYSYENFEQIGTVGSLGKTKNCN